MTDLLDEFLAYERQVQRNPGGDEIIREFQGETIDPRVRLEQWLALKKDEDELPSQDEIGMTAAAMGLDDLEVAELLEGIESWW